MNEPDLHEDRPLRPLSARRLALTVAGALALLAVVVLASRGDRPSGGAEEGQTAGALLFNAVLLIVAVVGALLVATTLLAFTPGKQAVPKPRTGPKLAGQLIVGVLLIGVVLAAIAFFRSDRDDQQQRGDPPRPAQGGTRTAQQEQERTADVDWLPVILLFGASLVAFTTLGIVMLRRGPLPPDQSTLAEQLSRIFDETLDDLHAEADPRRAVIASYARMERILAAHGLPRRPAEAPHEYVGRVLEDITSSATAVRRLTRLFERAKFSAHAVGPEMKDEAIAALEAVRDEVRAREAEPLIKVPH